MAEPIDWAIEHLKQSRQYNIDNRCLPGETLIIDKMLDGRSGMAGVFRNLAKQVGYPQHRRVVLNRIVATLAHHGPGEITQAREAAERVQGLNNQIHKKLVELLQLFKTRKFYANTAEVTTPDDGCTSEWLLNAMKYEPDSIRQHGFDTEIRPALTRMADRFFSDDCWPSREAVFTMLAEQQLKRPPEHATYTMEAASGSKKGEPNPAIVRALWECQRLLIGKNYPTDSDDSIWARIPLFRLNNPSMAVLANIVAEDGSGRGTNAVAISQLRGEQEKKAKSLLKKPFDPEFWNEGHIALAEDRLAFWVHKPPR